MSVIDPIWKAGLLRHWPVVGAFTVFFAFVGIHQIWFVPTAKRYERALTQASELGLAFDPERAGPMLPPRLFALISDNSLPEAVAQEQGSSGALTAELLARITKLASAHGLEVLSTEPGPVTQQKQSVQVRSHVRLRGRYQELVSMLDELARSDDLVAMDRLSLSASNDGQAFLELWTSRYVLKRTKGSS